MKPFSTIVLGAVLGSMLLGGCAEWRGTNPPPPPAPPPPSGLLDPNGVPIEKIPFRTGISSATVEKLARQQACVGGAGAGLITEPGPVEVYRMQCDNGKVFMARCELRQCKPM